MTYEDDWEIIKNAGKSLASATVDTSIALVQDVANVSGTLYANAVNNVASKEEWEQAFDGFWGKAWSKQGGIKDMLIDLGNETFEDIFLNGSKSSKASVQFSNGSGKVKFSNSSDSVESRVKFSNDSEFIESGVKFSNNSPTEEVGKVGFNNIDELSEVIKVNFDNFEDFEKFLKNKVSFQNKPIVFPKYTYKPDFHNGKFKVSKYNFSSKRVYKENPALEKIYNAGPLLYSNMFDVAFVIRKRHIDAKDAPVGQKETIIFLKNKIDIEKNVESKVRNELFNVANFSVRCANVTIPMASQQTFQQKFLECSVERPNSIVNFDNQSSLSIDMDANLYYLDFFQSLAGHRPNYGYMSGVKRTWSDTPAQAANMIGNKDYILDVVVTSRNLHSWHPLKYNPTTEAGDWANICYIFQDVKFLGTDSIKFGRESTAIQTCTFEFIFRSLETLYKNNEDVAFAPESRNEDVVFNERTNITWSGLTKEAMVDTHAGQDLYRK